jgi:integrase
MSSTVPWTIFRKRSGQAGGAGFRWYLKKNEISAILELLPPLYRLMARLIYGCGLRVQECTNLRIKDLDFEQGSLTVRSGKGDKDRLTVLPESLKNDLQAQIMLAILGVTSPLDS